LERRRPARLQLSSSALVQKFERYNDCLFKPLGFMVEKKDLAIA